MWNGPIALTQFYEILEKRNFLYKRFKHLCIDKSMKNVFFEYLDDKKSEGSNGNYNNLESNIYHMVVNKSGTQEIPTKLPFPINSEFEDVSPFITEDGKWLYFSSNREDSFGDFDIYRVKIDDLNNSNDLIIEHLPYPINSGANDLFYMEYEGKAYFSSDRIGGFGGMDIYHYDLPKE